MKPIEELIGWTRTEDGDWWDGTHYRNFATVDDIAKFMDNTCGPDGWEISRDDCSADEPPYGWYIDQAEVPARLSYDTILEATHAAVRNAVDGGWQ